MRRILLAAWLVLLVPANLCWAQAGQGFVVKKVCGKCKQVVPDDSKTGDTCPFCGAKWADEDGNANQKVKGNEGVIAPRSQTHAWDRVAESDSYTYGSLIWRWVVIGTGLVVSAIIIMYTVRFLKNNV